MDRRSQSERWRERDGKMAQGGGLRERERETSSSQQEGGKGVVKEGKKKGGKQGRRGED